MRLDNTQVAISKTCEASFNTPEATAANYEWLPTTDPFFLLPKLEKTNDANRVGRNAASHQCNTYWSSSQVSVKDDLQTGAPARLLRRGLGGSVTDTLVTAGVYDHEFAILPPQIGDVLPSFNILAVLGAADFRLGGLMVNKFKISQKNAERVQHEFDIVGSGKFTNPSGITPFPTLGDTPCMDGHKTRIAYSDLNDQEYVLSELGVVSEWMIEQDNKLRTNRRRIGDPVQSVTYNGVTAEGAYVRKMPRGKYTTAGQLVLDFVDLTDWKRSVINQELVNLKILIPGPIITGAYRHEVELIIPRFNFDSPDTGSDEDDATTPINIVCLEDTVTRGTMKCRVRNASATLI